jgi:multidrug efflux pump subunit AcrA (membrane-fusion protein)
MIRLTALLFLGSLAVAMSGCHRSGQAATDEEKKAYAPVPVHVVPAELRTMTQVVVGLGSCEPLLNKTATLTPVIEGRVMAILARPGKPVKGGQAIVQLDNRRSMSGSGWSSIAR